MNKTRRDLLTASVGALSTVALAGCTGETDDSTADSPDDDSDDSAAAVSDEPDNSDPEDDQMETTPQDDEVPSPDDSGEHDSAESLELLAETSVGHIHACSHAKFDDRTALDASESVDDAPTVERTHVIWELERDGVRHIVFDASGYDPGTSLVFYVAHGTALPVEGAELERDEVEDDTCELLDEYVVVDPAEETVVLALGTADALEAEYPEASRDASDTEGDGYDTYYVNGEEVPFVPTPDVYEWYDSDEELLVVDSRSEAAYEKRRIDGAVSSPSADESDDLLEDVSPDTRIVTYCSCPGAGSAAHRGAELLGEGYTEVYVLEDGLDDWIERGYPLAGTEVGEAD